MNKSTLSPEKSIELIEEMIHKARIRFEENGFAFILWECIVTLASFSQTYLLYNGYGKISWYPYFIMPLGMVYMMWYYRNKERKIESRNHLSVISSRLWLFTGLNIMLMGFFFSTYLQTSLVPIILILIGIATGVAASFIRSKLLLYCGLMFNVGGYIAFFTPAINHPLLMGVLSILGFLIPGIILHYKYKKEHV